MLLLLCDADAGGSIPAARLHLYRRLCQRCDVTMACGFGADHSECERDSDVHLTTTPEADASEEIASLEFIFAPGEFSCAHVDVDVGGGSSLPWKHLSIR